MNDDKRRERIIRRDEDMRRLRQLTVAAGVVGIGLFGAASIVAASNQPGHAIGAPAAPDASAVERPIDSSLPSFQPPPSAPLSGYGSRGVAVSGGS